MGHEPLDTRDKTRPNILHATERRRRIFELRKAGASFRQIAEALVNQFGADGLPKGYGPREVHRDCSRELQRLHRETALDVQEVVQLELVRLDALLFALWPKALVGDVQAVDRVMKIMQRSSALQGVTTPVVIDWRVEVKQLLRDGTVTPAMVRTELGPELAAEILDGLDKWLLADEGDNDTDD